MRGKSELSDFTYRSDIDDGELVIVIKDQNLGRRSVTTNMEAVLNFIRVDTGLCLPRTKIIYRDSDGFYDGVRTTKSGEAHIYPLVKGRRVTDEAEALRLVRCG